MGKMHFSVLARGPWFKKKKLIFHDLVKRFRLQNDRIKRRRVRKDRIAVSVKRHVSEFVKNTVIVCRRRWKTSHADGVDSRRIPLNISGTYLPWRLGRFWENLLFRILPSEQSCAVGTINITVSKRGKNDVVKRRFTVFLRDATISIVEMRETFKRIFNDVSSVTTYTFIVFRFRWVFETGLKKTQSRV